MGKLVFFIAATLVGCLAAVVYLWQSGTLQEFVVLQTGQTETARATERAGTETPTDPANERRKGSETKHVDRKDFKSESPKTTDPHTQNDAQIPTPPQSKGDNKIPTPPQSQTVAPPSPPPPGHLKKLGEHGSLIITGEIEELDYVLNGKDFYTHFIRKRRPVVLRGAASEWPAFKLWHNESYLESKYGDVVFDVEYTKKFQLKPPVKHTMNMSEFLKVSKKEDVYMDSPFPQSPMTEDLRVPYCLQCKELISNITSTHLLYSNGGTSSSLHYDGNENLLTVLSGRKEVLIANYSYIEYFHLDQLKTVTEKITPHAPVDPEAVDLIKGPNFAKIPFHKVTINAGDLLYIPQTWWHHVRSFNSPNIAISLWFHVFKEYQSESSEEDEDQDEDEATVEYMKKFSEVVENSPTTIDCESQNRPISEVFWPKADAPNQPYVEDPGKWIADLASGYKMPMKGFGTAGLFADTKDAVLIALKAGYRLIDTAQANGYNETAVGLAMKESGIPREEVFVVSKVQPRHLGYDDTLNSVEESLQKLQTSYIDLMLIHSMECEENEPGNFLTCEKGEPRGTWQDCWRALEALVQQGKVHSIGVSNFEVEHLQQLKEIAKVPPSVVQNFFTPFYQDRKTREFCKENNIKYMGFSTLGGMYVREGFDENPVMTDDGLKRIANDYDASVSQLVLKWALERDVIVIPRSRTPNHIETNFHLGHVQLSDNQTAYFEFLDGKFDQTDAEEEEVPVIKDNTDEEHTAPKEEETTPDETRQKPVRDKSIIDKLVLIKKVNPSDATLYVSSDDQWIYALDAKTGDLMWKYGTAEDCGSMCAFSPDETIVYCGTDDKSVRAFNRLDGTLLWRFETEGAVTSSTRVGADGLLYVGCLDGYIYCINADGTLKWKKHLGDQVWATPALHEGGRTVFITSMATEPNNVFALNGQTGDIQWQYRTGGPVFSSPVLSPDKKVVYVCSFDANCYAFDTATGKVLWVFEGDASYQSSPAVSKSKGLMFVAGTEGNVICVDTTTGKLKWIYKAQGEFFSTAFVAPDGRVYVGSGKGEVLALDQSDGSLAWSFRTETGDMVYSTPKMTKDGVLYIGAVDGYLYALKSDDGKLIWKFKTNGPLVGTVRIPQEHAMEQD